ncbi:MAG: nicotinate phosphoribosyltransferase [Candidatus Terrybacteria bacterium RIFCSPHIGHO2_01_FULL_48_17]|uniref:Nicotinate phosphoribosyltransferase n=1 Tax=Candidatus Terrybacteria bacterium RIFCSPHIGHO2_01_FULL_48_17 TaxID=1802362 RepID=A0A1G2PJ53_9BACT|nr:MAG: nicotinate phosphoribosyltransferase [Candidatus Terrybacteria bacterium RIFCSPHIGHO2_01_FULL_48_17]OHA53114.1 MAG: nicotinate phosphoribosyltransferase [Candidatus Terrybacteria bacterium RIFCSPLOWO2_01_FULL_48_14]
MPIVPRLLDVDFYKLTMAQVAWKCFRSFPVTYGFTNRTKDVALSAHINQERLQDEFAYVRGRAHFSNEELNWLRRNPIFSEDFIRFLGRHIEHERYPLDLPPVQAITERNTLTIKTTGDWPQTILWETIVLSIVNELYYRDLITTQRLSQRRLWREGERRLLEKIATLKRHPEVKFVEFGTRRRFSRKWQKRVLEILLAEIPDQVLGTSNVLLAKEFEIKPIGTHAHEMFMILYGYFRSLNDAVPVLSAHQTVLKTWWEEYGESLSLALTDTFGTEFFLDNFTPDQAWQWRGMRQDSGDPIEIGEKIVSFYQKQGISPKEKLLLFSDGLTLPKIIELSNRFSDRIQVSFGWGTNLTNDLGPAPLSLVMKATEACGVPTVKLSDNPAKATGPADEIERVKREVGYKDRPAQAIVY